MDELQSVLSEQNRELRSFINDYLLQLAYVDLRELNSDEYYDSLKDTKPFRPRETSQRRIEKEEGIGKWLKIKVFFSASAQQELEEKRKRAVATYKEIHKYEVEQNRKNEEKYYKRQDEYNRGFEALKEKARNNYQDSTPDYFREVLLSDEFYLNLRDAYALEGQIEDYDREKHELIVGYRIPNDDEIVNIKEFKIDKNTQSIVPVYLSKKATTRNILIMKLILLRTVALIYLSDTYKNLKSVRIRGYLSYCEYGDYKQRDVVDLIVTKDDFAKASRLNLQDIPAIEQYFDDIKKKKRFIYSADLYKKPNDEIKGLYE